MSSSQARILRLIYPYLYVFKLYFCLELPRLTIQRKVLIREERGRGSDDVQDGVYLAEKIAFLGPQGAGVHSRKVKKGVLRIHLHDGTSPTMSNRVTI